MSKKGQQSTMILIKETKETAGKILGTLRPNLLMQN